MPARTAEKNQHSIGYDMNRRCSNVSAQSPSSSSLLLFSRLAVREDPSVSRQCIFLVILMNWVFETRDIEFVLDRRKKLKHRGLNQRRLFKGRRCRSWCPRNCWKLLYLSLIVYLGIPFVTRGQDATGEPSTDGPFANQTTAPGGNETDSEEPTLAPTNSTDPIDGPTLSPTTTHYPTNFVSDSPSVAPTFSTIPSAAPSVSPTVQPTSLEPSFQDGRFRQKFLVGNGRVFTDSEILLFQGLYSSYTATFASATAIANGQIMTTCVVDAQEGLAQRRLRYRHSDTGGRDKWRVIYRNLQSEPIQAVNVDYTMTYESRYYNVTTYPLLFQNWVNSNLETVTGQMQLLQLNVTEAQTASRIILRTPAPTISIAPSQVPSFHPSESPIPSSSPSWAPSDIPTVPTPPTLPPSTASSGSSNNPLVVITVSTLVGFTIVAIGLLIYCRKRRHTREREYQAASLKKKQEIEVATQEGGWPTGSGPLSPNNDDSASPEATNFGSAPGNGPSGILSPSESLVSNQSLLSAGNSMAGDSGDEVDTTQIFADEFDQYKDQKLEKMRADIEGNLEGCDGMMSQAVARALIEEDDLTLGTGDCFWGGDENVTGPEIEASALGDVMDRLKLDENASVEEK
jgi:hypothetical protein